MNAVSYTPPTQPRTYSNAPRPGRIVVSPVGDGRYDMEWLDAEGAVKTYKQSKHWTYVASVLRQGGYK